MKTVTNKLYEAMFLVDSALAAQDWEGILDTIKNILNRAGAEIVSLRKWAERKLAYPIDHKIRGTYILCYFRADGSRVRDIERSVKLSEHIMRVLILSTEERSPEDIKKDTVVQEEDVWTQSQEDSLDTTMENGEVEVAKKDETESTFAEPHLENEQQEQHEDKSEEQ